MNPFLQRLGFAPDDRVVIFHADDVGMCQATLPAYEAMLDAGLLSSASTMVPCAWFPALAGYCRRHPEVDMGVHITLTAEWDAYRWAPLTSSDPAEGLVDEEGYCPRRQPPLWDRADAVAVRRESEAQVARALAAGLRPTHLDNHMGVSNHPRFLADFVYVALANHLPLRELRTERRRQGDDAWAAAHRQMVERLEQAGYPFFDARYGLPLDDPDDQVGLVRRIVDELPAGLSIVILHPAADTPELRALAPDWRSRVANYEAMLSREIRNHVRQRGVQVIGFRALQEQIAA